VKVIPVSGFGNIDYKYEIGMNKLWLLHEFMHEQPKSLMKVPVDVDKVGYKIKGTKIMALPKHVLMAAKAVYENFG
jgi:hypothetical protein